MMSLAIGRTHDDCPCVICTGHNVTQYDRNNRPYTANTVHGKLEPCHDCGRPKTEYVDHGSWCEFECWWCTDRSTDEL